MSTEYSQGSPSFRTNSAPQREQYDNLWLAQELYRLGAIRFGDFTVGRTLHTPVYVDLRVLVGSPATLGYAARLIRQETHAEQLRRRPTCDPFDIVAGVPFGGLHLATAYALYNDVPLVYARQRSSQQAVVGSDVQAGSPLPAAEEGSAIQGVFRLGQSVLVIDDLITTGGSIVDTVEILCAAGLEVKDAVVLVDREQGGGERLKELGVRLHSILRLPIMLNLYMSSGLIDEDIYRRCVTYLEENRRRL
ncbi:MAG: phosphoribosyltransferase [Chloroflexi bacterium]|nr:phosphoribosyltransferase [Chloroflexota bacterium]